MTSKWTPSIGWLMGVGLVLCATWSCRPTSQQYAWYSGQDMSQVAQVVYDSAKQHRSIHVNYPTTWSVYAGTTDTNINLHTPICQGVDTGQCPVALPPNLTHGIYLIKTDKGQALVSDQVLPMQGGYNIRDLGGIRTADGRFVKWGRVLRGDELGRLTTADWAYLRSVPLVSIVDLRSRAEVQATPDNAPDFVKNQIHLPIAPGNLSVGNMQLPVAPTFNARQFMMDLNVQLVSDSVCVAQYRTLFALLQSADYTPLLFHCTAGKDRTGMGAALFLAALGVDQATIFDNYMQSNTYLEAKYAGYIQQYPHMKDLMMVHPQYLQAGLDYVKAHHGSVEQYLVTVLGVDIQHMRDKYLY